MLRRNVGHYVVQDIVTVQDNVSWPHCNIIWKYAGKNGCGRNSCCTKCSPL